LLSLVERGVSIPIPGLQNNACAHPATENLPLLDLGFDADVLAKQESGY
jgi:hypothetical protein